ncbi:MAG TPA: hypothetical protein VH083_08670, partial [Myxococcales bacterium]|nr:hypothetical protein [Myxococcales bacterium]
AILRRWRQREVTDVERSWITAFDVHWVSKGLPADVRSRPLDLRLLRRTLKERASDLLGEKMPESGSSKVRYDLDVGDAVLLTFFEIGTSTKQLSYDQILRLKHLPGPPVQIVSSPLAWYGLWRETSWDALSPGDEEAAVDQLFGFCRRFMATIPDLLQRAGKSSAPDAGMA